MAIVCARMRAVALCGCPRTVGDESGLGAARGEWRRSPAD